MGLNNVGLAELPRRHYYFHRAGSDLDQYAFFLKECRSKEQGNYCIRRGCGERNQNKDGIKRPAYSLADYQGGVQDRDESDYARNIRAKQ